MPLFTKWLRLRIRYPSAIFRFSASAISVRRMRLFGASGPWFVVALLFACGPRTAAPSSLDPYDLTVPVGAKFDPGLIVPSNEVLEDDGAISREAIVNFLDRTPYLRPSFLAAYASNGVLAVDAILRVAERQRLNPLVFLVRLQASQGLIGERFYPSNAKRVEYAFGCGCNGKGRCDPAYAGLDRQLDCLGTALRTSLTEMAETQQPETAERPTILPGYTAGGWGRERDGLTYDGILIRPKNEATAALYQYEPLVLEKSGGAWVVWNLWNQYTKAIGYKVTESAAPVGNLGQACTRDRKCTDSKLTCRIDAPGTLCTLACDGACPGGSVCANRGTSAYCLSGCTVSCRSGYSCKNVGLKPTGMALACVPN
jgi:hypothetical protein